MDERTSNEPVIDPEEILEGIKTWVDIETPSHLGEEVNKLVDLVENRCRRLELRSFASRVGTATAIS